MPHDTCRACGELRAPEDFARDKTQPSGHKSICKACDREKSRRYYAANREKQRVYYAARYAAKPKKEHAPVVCVCAVCGCTFEKSGRGRDPRYCSPGCRNRRPRRAADFIERACEQCGQPFTTEARYGQRYCGKSCATKARSGSRPKKSPKYKLAVTRWYSKRCLTCNSPVLTKTAHQRYCSTTCSNIAKRCAAAGLSPRDPLRCHECGTTWLPADAPGRSRYCSETCATRHARRVSRKRRDKRIRSSAKREAVSLPKVAERDGWRCHICKRQVTRATWSIDHLIPLSHGGDHTYANVALAHHRCNTLRGAHGAAQLRLVA